MNPLLIGLELVCVAAFAAAARGDGQRRYYTEARLETMRRNLEQYPWARQLRDATLADADRWAKYDDATLRALVSPPSVPRCYDLHSFGCPVHGEKAYEKGLYQWGISFERPYGLVAESGKSSRIGTLAGSP